MASTRSGRKARAERRRAPRADIKVPLKIKRARDVIVGSTKNISASGAYIMLDTFVPLNTKLNVTLLIPKAGRGQPKKVQCRGIVVRNRPERGGAAAPHYSMAIFFTDIDQRDQRALSDYVKQRMSLEEQRRLARRKGPSMRYDPGEVFSTRSPGEDGFSISSANFRVFGEQINLSKNGIRCQIDRSIPLFREIAVNLVLPRSGRARGRGEPEVLQCSAVVVGCGRIGKSDRYDMAAYFVGLSKERKKRLEDCIKKFV